MAHCDNFKATMCKINKLPGALICWSVEACRVAPYIDQCFCDATFATYRKGWIRSYLVNFLDFAL